MSSAAGAGAAGTGQVSPPDPDAGVDFFPTDTDLSPSPDNPPECPATAPENPVGDCLGLPVYVECLYGNYYCICDWFHWLCI